MLVRHVGPAVAVAVLAGFVGVGAVTTPASVPAAVGVGALAGIAGFALVAGRASPPGAPQPAAVQRRAVRVGIAAAGVAAIVVPALSGTVALLGVATAPLLLLGLFAATPWAWNRLATRFLPDPTTHDEDPRSPRQCPLEPSPATGPRPLVSVLASLSTPALCGQWQASYLVLTATTDPVAREQVVALRRRYLDELDRRDPHATARWLAADLRPAGTSPARHLTPRPLTPRTETPPDVPRDPERGAPLPFQE